jgi:hypothetical protein
MNHAEAILLYESIPDSLKKVLMVAHTRYMHFTGLHVGDVCEEQIEEDRARFASLLRHTKDGKPTVTEDDCVVFMEAVTGLPECWCRTFDRHCWSMDQGAKYEESIALLSMYGDDLVAPASREPAVIALWRDGSDSAVCLAAKVWYQEIQSPVLVESNLL